MRQMASQLAAARAATEAANNQLMQAQSEASDRLRLAQESERTVEQQLLRG